MPRRETVGRIIDFEEGDQVALLYDVYGKAYQSGTAVEYFDGKMVNLVSISQDTVDLEE